MHRIHSLRAYGSFSCRKPGPLRIHSYIGALHEDSSSCGWSGHRATPPLALAKSLMNRLTFQFFVNAQRNKHTGVCAHTRNKWTGAHSQPHVRKKLVKVQVWVAAQVHSPMLSCQGLRSQSLTCRGAWHRLAPELPPLTLIAHTGRHTDSTTLPQIPHTGTHTAQTQAHKSPYRRMGKGGGKKASTHKSHHPLHTVQCQRVSRNLGVRGF